jgi:protease-4
VEKRSALTAFLVFGGLLGLCFGFFYLLFASLEPTAEREWGGSGPRIGVVDVSGVISESRDTLGRLRELRKDDKVKAIVVRVDSPGGAVAPSQEIYDAILRVKKDKKVVCSMGTVAASGGYYVASACDKIVAAPGTITGSIGVISEMPHVQDLLRVAQVQVDTIKSGALKDVGSPLRPMTTEERQFFQRFVDGVYEQFLDDVSRARKLDKETLRKIADGRILTGKQALDAQLVDQLGNFEDALELAVKLAGATGEPVPLFQKKTGHGLLGEMMRGALDGLAPRGAIELRDPRF